MHPNSFLIGAHTSAAGGLFNALLEGQRIGATTIQLFTANQRQWLSKPLSEETLSIWHQKLLETGLQKIMSHASYLINLASYSPEIYQKSIDAFKLEIERCKLLNISYLNFHPGAALKEDPQKCLDRIADSLISMKPLLENSSLRLLLESTAGQGSCLGHSFEQLNYIIQKVENEIPIGVCIDTCHCFVAGYDISTPQGVELTLSQFDEVVGLKHLYAFHINDAKGLGSKLDRHKALGEGEIGLESFKSLMKHEKTKYLPKYLETPGGPPLWEKEIILLRNYANEGNVHAN